MKTKEQLLIEKIRLLENLVYNLTYRGERKERLNLRKQLTSLTDQINEVKKKKQQPMEYLNGCIEKATPNLSKIKDVDKELAEIRGEQSEISSEQDAITWVSNRLPILVKSKWSKRKVVYPYANNNVSQQIAEHLGKEVWKLLNQ